MKPRFSHLFAACFIGCALTVLLAWGCAIFSEDLEPRQSSDVTWTDLPPTGFPLQPEYVVDWRGYGLRRRMAEYQRVRVFGPWQSSLRLYEETTVEAGWPFPALAGTVWRVFTSRAGDSRAIREHHDCAIVVIDYQRRLQPRFLPYRLLWVGLAFDVIIWATVAYLARLAFIGIRCRIRRRNSRCPACACDLGYRSTDRCPECGIDVASTTRRIPVEH